MFALLGMLAIGYLVAGRIFAPIKSLTEFARGLGEDRLGDRIPVGDKRDELDSLALEFNRMLDRLEDAFQSQRQFVDIAGHELRTPLTIIRGHFDLMRANPDEADSAMPIIQDELQRMSRLVGDLQALTKSGSPDFVHIDEVDLKGFTDELRAKVAAMTKRKVGFESSEGKWRLDAQRISQATLQLVENALRHTPKSAKINVAFESLDHFLLIVVEDSGKGVQAELRESIFEPFIRGAGKQNIDGSGIGLSLVRAIAQAHGGSAAVDESPLGGARFVVKIPR
jgi:signal transduction histidine kinase